MSEAVRVQNAERHLAASQKLYQCKSCKLNLVRCEFWPSDIRYEYRGMACKKCCPKPPGDRRALLTCKGCERELPKDRFWPGDLAKADCDFRCKECQPTPPMERRTIGGTGGHRATMR